MQEMSYAEARPMMETGDSLLWKSNGLIGRVISRFCRGVSHVGFVYEQDGIMLTLESTTMNHKLPDFYSKTPKSGMQCVSLSSKIAQYIADGGEVWWRHLEMERTPEFYRDFNTFRLKTSGVPYERNWIEWAASALRFFAPFSEDRSAMFCSEAKAAGSYDTGILRLDAAARRPSNSYSPGDWVPPDTLPLGREAKLGPMVRLTLPIR